MTISATQMPICLSNSSERGRGHAVTIQNRVLFVLRPQLSNRSSSCVGGKDILSDSGPLGSDHLSRIKFQSYWVLWVLVGVRKDMNGGPRTKKRQFREWTPSSFACGIQATWELKVLIVIGFCCCLMKTWKWITTRELWFDREMSI